jgi:hypothetical protein
MHATTEIKMTRRAVSLLCRSDRNPRAFVLVETTAMGGDIRTVEVDRRPGARVVAVARVNLRSQVERWATWAPPARGPVRLRVLPTENRRRACCECAVRMPRGFGPGACVCDESWTCAVHGETHFGTHD